MKRVEPEYPRVAARARIAGIVVLQVIVERDGTVSAAQVLKPLPFGLDQAALNAVFRWRFRPGYQNGRAVRSLYTLTVKMTPPAP